MAISMLKIRRPLGRLIFNMGITIPGKTVFLIETAPRYGPPSSKPSAMLSVIVYTETLEWALKICLWNVLIDVIKWKYFHRNSPFVEGIHRESPSQRPVTWRFDVFFDLRLNKRFSKQSRRLWFEIPSHPLWRHCNEPSLGDSQDDIICKLVIPRSFPNTPS